MDAQGSQLPKTPWPPVKIDGKPRPLDTWDGRRFMMTHGQVAMMDAAIARVEMGDTYHPA